MRTIARFRALAEVGYWADVLEQEGIPTDVAQHSEHSAMDGTTVCYYFLQVPHDRVDQAKTLLRKQVEQDEAQGDATWDTADGRRNSAFGLKVVMSTMLLAGVAFMMTSDPLGRGVMPVQRDHDRVLHKLRHAQEGLVAEHPDAPRQRLRYDSRMNRIILEQETREADRYVPVAVFQ